MGQADLVELARSALMHAALLSGPMLVVGIVVGILAGALQAVTQIHDQVLSFAPKLLIVLVVFSLTLPWFMQQITEYAARLFSTAPPAF